MANVTVNVPNDLKQDMNALDEINWSAVARKAFDDKVKLMKKMNELLKNSKLTEEDAVKLGRKVNKGMLEKHYKKMVK